MMPRYPRRQFLGIAAAALAQTRFPLPESRAGDEAAAKTAPRPFRYAICNETFEGWPLERACAFAAECGYAGLELAPFTLADRVTDVPAQRRSAIRRTIEKAGLVAVGLHWLLAKTTGYHLTSPDVEVRRRTAEYLAELARFCADVGGQVLVFGSPKQRDLLPGVTPEEAMGFATEVIRRILPALEKTRVVLAIEPLAPETTTFITTAEQGMELVRRVDSPWCCLHLDCRAMASETVPIPELLRRHRRHLVHFHANDPNGQGPGFGKLDFVPILRALREIEYRGWISVEVFDLKPGVERTARQSIGYLKRCASQL